MQTSSLGLAQPAQRPRAGSSSWEHAWQRCDGSRLCMVPCMPTKNGGRRLCCEERRMVPGSCGAGRQRRTVSARAIPRRRRTLHPSPPLVARLAHRGMHRGKELTLARRTLHPFILQLSVAVLLGHLLLLLVPARPAHRGCRSREASHPDRGAAARILTTLG